VHAPAEVLEELVACLDSPDLAALQWSEEFAVVQARMPPTLAASLAALVREHEAELAAYGGAALQLALLQPTFPAEELLGTMRAALAVRRSPLGDAPRRDALRCAAHRRRAALRCSHCPPPPLLHRRCPPAPRAAPASAGR
jgi:hypothetical protein